VSETTNFTFRSTLTKLGVLTSHATAFLIVVAYGVVWWYFEPATLEWHAIATLATWFMTFLIQRATHRDNQALHAKLDELIKSSAKAKSSIVSIDAQEPEEIERHRKRQKR
jgi:low affinity Fe/Cu permease